MPRTSRPPRTTNDRMPISPPSTTTPERELFLHSDPTAVAAWCRARATPGGILVAPSASARRHALRRVVDARAVALGLNIVSPGRLLPLLEGRAGLTEPSLLPAALERLLVEESARAARVPLFADDGFDTPAGAASAVARLIDVLRLNGVTPKQYSAAGGTPSAADAYRRFEARRIALGFEDRAGRIARLLSHQMPAVPLVMQDPVFLNRAAYDLYRAAIDSAPSCRIGIADLAPHDGAPSPVVARLEELGFSPTRAHAAAAPSTVRAIGGAGMHDEVAMVARHMLSLLRAREQVQDDSASGGRRALRPHDILGVAPTGNYLQLLGEACVRVGVPVASPRRLDVLDVPLVRALLDAFRLLSDEKEDTPERGLALLATPYVGLSLHEHDRLSRVLTWRARGSLRDWRRHAMSTGRRKFQAFANDVPVMVARMRGDRTPRELTRILTTLALDHGFLSAGSRAHLAAGQDDAVRIDQQGWDALVSAMKELNDAFRQLGIVRVPARRWLAELVQLLAGAAVRVDPKMMDGVHLTVAGAGLPSAAHVFAVGWREGLVPRRVRDEPLLPDRVKRALNEMGAMFPLAADRAARDYEHRERVRRAARETLTISWPATNEEGEPLLPSIYLHELGIAKGPARSIGDTTWPLDLAASREERVTRATFLARHRPAAALGAELHAVRETLAALTPAELRAYDDAGRGTPVIDLPAELRAELAPLAEVMSASQAGTVAHCLYQHFGTKRLKLKPLALPQVDQRFLGTIAHGVLCDVARAGFDPNALDASVATWWKCEVPRALWDDAGARFERDLLMELLTGLVHTERQRAAQSASRPAFFELAFGLDTDGRDPASCAEGLVVALPPGTPITASTLRGAIDRVDIIERDGTTYGVAIDYKLGKGESYNKEMKEMADFQLPVYCQALPLFGIEAVGAYYLGLADGERYGVVRSDYAEAFLLDDCTKVAKLAPDAFQSFMRERDEALRVQIARVARGELEVKPRKDDCKYCELRPVCRIGTFGVGGGADDE